MIAFIYKHFIDYSLISFHKKTTHESVIIQSYKARLKNLLDNKFLHVSYDNFYLPPTAFESTLAANYLHYAVFIESLTSKGISELRCLYYVMQLVPGGSPDPE